MRRKPPPVVPKPGAKAAAVSAAALVAAGAPASTVVTSAKTIMSTQNEGREHMPPGDLESIGETFPPPPSDFITPAVRASALPARIFGGRSNSPRLNQTTSSPSSRQGSLFSVQQTLTTSVGDPSPLSPEHLEEPSVAIPYPAAADIREESVGQEMSVARASSPSMLSEDYSPLPPPLDSEYIDIYNTDPSSPTNSLQMNGCEVISSAKDTVDIQEDQNMQILDDDLPPPPPELITPAPLEAVPLPNHSHCKA